MYRSAGVLVTLAVAALVGCGSSSDSVSPEPPSGEPCSTFGDNVESYDVLADGASRAEYLTLLHKLQRDCPDEAQSRGLTNEGAPQCDHLDQENCTMWNP